jgi:uncharacterized protein (DUF433 family)
VSRDLVVLVPDKDIEQTFQGLLDRPQALGIRKVSYDILVHPNRDPGCYHTGPDLLRSYAGEPQRNALIVFDRAWEGAPSEDPATLARNVEDRLRVSWAQRTCFSFDRGRLDMKPTTLDQHIESTPGISGGKPRIAGHRITVQNIAVWHERLGKSADEIAAEYDLTLADVYAALAYYFDHRAEIDQSIAEGRAFAEALRQRTPSKVREKLQAQGADGTAD